MSKIKLGDRVAVYYANTVPYPAVGTVVEVRYDSWLVVDTLLSGKWNVHPKQCRKLIKKKRFECWVNIYSDEIRLAYDTEKEALDKAVSLCPGGFVRTIHMREVREK